MSAPQNSLQQPVWTLELFGPALLTGGATALKLERKTAALFAFLALEGATSRSKLAGLLWADSTEEAARSSLRQRLYRLRVAVGLDLIVSSDPLRLTAKLNVDVMRFESLLFTNDLTAALAFEGELLANLDFDDCPELSEWVLSARERLEASRREAGIGEADRLEQVGDYRAALAPARQVLLRDPISEDAHRRLMRLHYLAGDRPAALNAFRQCQSVLGTQLGVAPLPETQHLASLIELGETLPQAQTVTRFSIPIQILRPPVLVGRDRDWAQLEAAWQAGLGVVVRGQAGVGKTRLVSDFLIFKGEYVQLVGRPGDNGVGYASFARGLKRMLDSHQNLSLEPWVRRELSRIVPSIDAEPPPAIQSDPEKIRFYSSVLEMMNALATRGIKAVLVDDLQFMDAASVELWLYILSNQTSLLTYTAYRTGELEGEVEHNVLQTKHSLLELSPLEIGGLSELLTQLELPTAHLAESLRRYTGGNPMYVLETLKSLLETGGIARRLPQHFPPPQKIGALIRHRLERLSSVALRLARVAAVAETDFSLSLATTVLEMNALELTEPLHELEAAQVLIGERFAHDLIFESTLAGVPNSIQQLVHQKIAGYLETQRGNPARISQHWLAAGDQARAVPWIIKAQQIVAELGLLQESTKQLEQALTYQSSNDDHALVQAILAERYANVARLEEAEKLVEEVLKSSSFTLAKVQALRVLVEVRVEQGRLEEALTIFEQSLKLLALLGDEEEHYRFIFNGLHGVIAYRMGAFETASAIFKPLLENSEEKPNLNTISISMNLAACYDQIPGKSEEARVLHQASLQMAHELGSVAHVVQAASNYLYACIKAEIPEQGIAQAEAALESGEYLSTLTLRVNLAGAYFRMNRDDEAIKQNLILQKSSTPLFECLAAANLALLYQRNDKLQEAAFFLEQALQNFTPIEHPTVILSVARAVVLVVSAAQFKAVWSDSITPKIGRLSQSNQTELEELMSVRKRT